MKYHGPKEISDAAKSTLTSPEELSELAGSEYVFVRASVAQNPNTPIRALSELIPDKLRNDIDWNTDQKRWRGNKDKWQVLCGLLCNPNLPQELFLKISEILKPVLPSILPRDYYPIVAVELLAKSNSAPIEAVLVLSDISITPKHLRRRIANPSSVDALLKKLTADPSELIRKRAMNSLKQKELGK